MLLRELTDEQFLAKKNIILGILDAIVDDYNWEHFPHGLVWCAKRNLIQWVGDDVFDDDITRDCNLD